MKLWKKGCFAALVAISATCLLAALPPSAFSVDGIFTDGEGVVAATRVPRPDGRLAFRVPTEQGEITLFDYASVDCWHGTRICTWLPQPK